jgi:hypothetical protein
MGARARVVLVYPGDRQARDRADPRASRFAALFDAFSQAGLAVEPCIWRPTSVGASGDLTSAWRRRGLPGPKPIFHSFKGIAGLSEELPDSEKRGAGLSNKLPDFQTNCREAGTRLGTSISTPQAFDIIQIIRTTPAEKNRTLGRAGPNRVCRCPWRRHWRRDAPAARKTRTKCFLISVLKLFPQATYREKFE